MEKGRLSDKDIAVLRERGHAREYAAGDYVVHEGDAASTIFLLISGSAAVLTEDEDGNELCANILYDGDFFGELGLCSSQWVRSASVKMRQKSVVLEVNYGQFLRLAEQHNEFFLTIIYQISRKLNEMTRRARQFVHLSAPERVLYVLRDLADQPGANAVEEGMLVSITKREIGNIAGCSRETASRALQELEASGMIANSGRKVLVLRH